MTSVNELKFLYFSKLAFHTGLIIFILMDYPLRIDKLGMELSFLYFKGLSVKSFIK